MWRLVRVFFAQMKSPGLLIARAERVISEEIPALPDDVRAFYVDLHNIKTVHPLVVSVHATERIELADGYRQTYRVKDRIPLGPFTLPTSYVAHLTVATVGEVITEARQFPRVRLHGVVTFDSVGASTRILERLTIDAPRPLAPITVREAVKAHVEMLAGIRRHFGG
ncbi:MAG: hypothetical protein QOD39_3766 [Mycobacterium sp.]|nr:hypothetical protein [Mycobacterium sp.]